ncbi:MAG TPA: MSMEG_4193 family putative phosphomutase [Acidimicrobiales bacterium]|nr:MSMEG_4193 family putative phosphomutase [Acidimicrobiales bacterium]
MPRRPKPPPPTLALFVRHGRTPTTGKVLPGRAPGLHLADEGRAQAEAVAERLAAVKKVDALYSSPLERTRETAAPIGQRLKLRVIPEKGLLECDFGDWTGADLKALSKRPEWRGVQQHPSGFRFPGGESFRDMQARIAGTLGKLRTRHPGQTVVLVSHADPIKVAVADAAGTHLDLFQRVVISPCSITAIAYSDSGPFLLTVNSTGDLAELKVS